MLDKTPTMLYNLVILLIAALSIITSATPLQASPTNVSRNGNTSNNVPAWTCNNDSFFEMTVENLNASRASEHFEAWLKTVDIVKVPAGNPDKVDIINLYIKEFINPPQEYSLCSLNGYCKYEELADCDAIYRTLQDKEKTRQVFFTMSQLHNYYLVLDTMWFSASQMRGLMALKNPWLVDNFIWKEDLNAKDKCEQHVWMAKSFFMVTILALNFGTEGLAGPLGKGFERAVGRAASGIGNPTKTAKRAAKTITLGNNVYSNVEILRPADDWESLICPDLASPPPDLDAKLLAGVNQYADQSIEALVTYLEDHWRGIQLGIWKSKKDDLAGSLEESFLAQILRNQDFFTFDEEEQRFFSQPSIVTKHLEQTFVQRSIASLLTAQGCYIHCTKEQIEPVPDLEKARFQPLDEVMTCQHQCWRNSLSTKNVFLYGLDELLRADNPFNVTIGDIEQMSIDLWRYNKDVRDSRVEPGLTIDDLIPDDANVKPKGGAGLPVCLSTMKPGAFQTNDNNEDKKLPCTCGDPFGSETMDFFSRTSLAGWVGYDNGTGLARACSTSFARDKTRATQVFRTYCQLGQHWPRRDDPDDDDIRHFMPGKDPNCPTFETTLEELRQKSASRGLDHLKDIDCQMCIQDVAVSIMETQENGWEPSPYSRGGDAWCFEKACLVNCPNLEGYDDVHGDRDMG